MANIEADARDRADMERLASGHDAALNDLMERHATGVFQFLFRMLRNEDDANDLAQETFLRVFKARTNFKLEQKFNTWLYTIAANLARNHIRWRSRHPDVSLEAEPESGQPSLKDSLPDGAANAREKTIAAERHAAVRAAVDALPSDMREAIVLCEWQDLAVAEAATVAKTTPKAMESRLYRARQVLREELKRLL